MKKLLLALTCFIVVAVSQTTSAQQTQTWKSDLGQHKGFIENKGQFRIKAPSGFDAKVVFAHDGNSEDIYFTTSGHVIDLTSLKKRKKTEEEKQERAARKEQGFNMHEEWVDFEMAGNKMEVTRDRVVCQWLHANADVAIESYEKNTFVHSYLFNDENGKQQTAEQLPSYKKLIYKNLYPGIDVVYEFHGNTGVKYSVILHPGADLTQVKLKYSKPFSLHEDGTIHTPTRFGDIIDYAPIAFYEGSSGKEIDINYEVTNNTISFNISDYDHTRTLVIDPWTQSPTFASNWDCVWECETDAAGNSYLIGGVTPLQLHKYNAAGALQWVYNTPYDTSAWLGTFVTDNAGNSYVTNGSAAAIIKVNTAGALVWNNPSPGGIFSSTEFWNIAFNCDQTQLVVGGTGGILPPLPYIYRIDMNSGNVINSMQVCGSTLAGFPPNTQEVRAITATKNEKYYFLTHDTIGYVSQTLTLCPGQFEAFHVNNSYDLGYKCENWRLNNTGIEAIAYYNNFIFVHRGNRLDKRDFNTGAILQSVAIPGGGFTSVAFGGNTVENSGIVIDDCGNIYVGSKNAAYRFNQSLTQTASYACAFNVYDVAITSTGDLILAGSTGNSGSASRTGSIQSFAAATCAQQAIVCCNPSICGPTQLCTSDAPVTLTAFPGGTWSGPAGLNTTTGAFNPAVAGVGSHTITYTLPCGSDSWTITVSNCVTVNVCIQANGSLVASSAAGGPYTWQQIVTTTPCNPGFGNFCGAFTVAGTPTTTYTTIGTNPTLNAPVPYPVQVTDGAGNILVLNSAAGIPACTGCPTLNIASSSQTNVTCFGQSTGSVTVSSSGGASPYDYVLLNGATTVATFNNIAGSQIFSGLAAGTYTLNVTDNNGCTGTTTLTITQPASAVSGSTSAQTNVLCFGNATGSATVAGNGGTGALSYSWNTTPVQTGATASGLAAGTYTCTITDANGCSSTVNVTITQPASGVTGSVSSQTNVLCFGNSTGSATVTGSGGTGALSYSWNTAPVQTGANATGLTAGTYTCTITDVNGCSSTVNATITQPASGVSVSLGSTTNATCGNNNGSATVSATGGTGAISYSWNTTPVQTGVTATGLGAGTYTVTATDANGCTGTLNVTINAAGGPTASLSSQTNVLCFGNATGNATVSGSGGTGALSYSWNTTPVQTGATASGLAAGTYTCTITDAGGCSATVNVTITQPANAVAVSLSSSTNAACGTSNGTATVSATGGTGALSYSWNTTPAQTGATASGLAAGTYIVTVTDANNCSSTLNVTIGTTTSPSLSLTSSSPSGCTGNTGSATVNGTGGTGALTYSWNTIPVQTGATVNGLAAGSYIATVTDANGCSNTLNVTIGTSTPPTVSLGSSTPSGCAANTGTATVNGAGGTGALTYSWNTNPAQTGPTATGLAAGIYTVTVTDANNCTATLNVTIGTSGGPSVSLTSQTNVLCNGGSTGNATVNGTGGTGVLSYSWNTSPAQTGATANGLAAGNYTVTVTDANNCTATLNVTITQPSAISISNAVTNTGCGVSTGSITATPTGGTGTYSYAWSSGGTAATENNLGAGTYTVTVTDANGCTQTQSSTIIVVGGANINASPNVTIPLGGSTTLFASGGISYTWSPSAGLSCTNCSLPVATPSVTTTYIVTGVDANGCVGTDTVRVFVEMPCGELFMPNAFSPNGDGENDEWQVYGTCIATMEIRIFNRWGEVVYYSTDPTQRWDGTIRGKAAEAAVFYYTFIGTTVDGEEYDTNGTITLMK